ncbi:hypothetical protein ELI15_14300 [Rhizobium ruizarguesonis]|uniref:hypothetical protein n=1 Tax=Rhizobium ruizarguesonis TaxID=2081791 RepID=UPI00102FA801|nr:hypothetical protein [Rhizobium ruizarguesonis]TAW65460.1 hypothetical protein ELI15_14300 [Rhizobium ruizarguesonis]
MSFLDKIENAGRLQKAFRRWHFSLTYRAPLRTTVGLDGKTVIKPRSYLDQLDEEEFRLAMLRIDEIFDAKPGTDDGYELEALSIAAEAYERRYEALLELARLDQEAGAI